MSHQTEAPAVLPDSGARTEEVSAPMSKPTVSPFKRYKTRHPGITYRIKADGQSRSYFVLVGTKQVLAGSTQSEALAKQAELRGQKARGERIVVNDKTTFGQLAEEWYASKARVLRPRTAGYYRRALDLVLIPRFGKWRVAALDADAIATFSRTLADEGLHAVDPKRSVRPLGRSSIDNYLKPLQGVLGLAVRKGLIRENPFNHLTADDRPLARERKRPHEWEDAELAALFAASERLANKPESRYDYTPLLRLASALGLRIGEVLGLKWEDFDKREGTLRVERQWLRTGEYGPTKTRAGVRELYLPEGVRDDLIALRLRSRYSRDDDPIFASLHGTPLTHRNVTRRGFEPAAKLAGLDVSFHDLRHAAASRMIAAGIDDALVADQLGHENSTITRTVYAHVYDRATKAADVRAALASSLTTGMIEA